MGLNSTEISTVNDLLLEFPCETELAVAKIVDGSACYYGVTHTDKVPLEVDNKSDVFEIGSITKVFTSSLLASMALRGELCLDSPINQSLPITIKNGQKILFRELATHSSGLPMMPPGIVWQFLFTNRDNPEKDYDEDRLLGYLENDLKLKKKKISYSNLGVGLLGYILARLSGRSYDSLISDTLFRPIGMHNSTSCRANVTNRLVKGLKTNGQIAAYSDLGVLEAAGSVLSTTEDLVKFALENFNEDNKALAYQRTAMCEDKYQSMALGWAIVDKANLGVRRFFHDGGTRGFSSSMLIDTSSKNGIIILSNISGMHKMKGQKLRKLAFELMNGLADEK